MKIKTMVFQCRVKKDYWAFDPNIVVERRKSCEQLHDEDKIDKK